MAPPEPTVMRRSWYSDSIRGFLRSSEEDILGALVSRAAFSVDPPQRDAWLAQVRILKEVLPGRVGKIYFEYAIPRMGSRIDTLLLIGPVIFVLEFKVGEKEFTTQALDQVTDYALDLKNFHETSHRRHIAPVLVATRAKGTLPVVSTTHHDDLLLRPIRTNAPLLRTVLEVTSRQVCKSS